MPTSEAGDAGRDELSTAGIVAGLVAARLSDGREPFPPPRPSPELRRAYEIQADFAAEWSRRRRTRPCGYKVSLTSLAALKATGASEPTYGVLFEEAVLPSGSELRLDRFFELMVEPELVFRLTADLPDDADRARIAASCEVMPGLELPDSALVGWYDAVELDAATVVVDNSLAGRLVLGDPLPAAEVDLVGSEVRVLRDDEELAVGSGAAVMGDPLWVVSWLHRKLAATGGGLKPGDLVSSGTMSAPQVAAPGEFRAEFGSLGTVSARFRPPPSVGSTPTPGSRAIEVAVASTWDELDPCNAVLRRTAAAAVHGVWAAGGRPAEASLPGPAEPIGAPTAPTDVDGREVVARATELVAAEAEAAVVVAGSGPALAGALLGLCRAAVPAVLLPGGPSVPGLVDGEKVTVDDVAAAAGGPPERLERLVEGAWLASGGPPVQGPAASMAAAIEAIGLCVPGSSGPPAPYQSRDRLAHAAGAAVVAMAADGRTAGEFVTSSSLENAAAVIVATGGSSEALRHLLAIAAELGLDFDLERTGAIVERTPRLADLRPHGRFDTVDFARDGGVPALLGMLLEGGLVHGEVPTVTGLTLAEAYGSATPWKALPVFVDGEGLPHVLTVEGDEIVELRSAAAPDEDAAAAVRRSSFRALGLADADLRRPLFGVVSIWSERSAAGADPMRLGEVAEAAAWQVEATPRRFALHAPPGDRPGATTARAATAAALELVAGRNRCAALLGIAADELSLAALMGSAVRLDLPVAIAALPGADPESMAAARAVRALGMGDEPRGQGMAAAEELVAGLGASALDRLRDGASARTGVSADALAVAAAGIGELGAAPDLLVWLHELAVAAGLKVDLRRVLGWADEATAGRIALLAPQVIAAAPPGAAARLEAKVVPIPADAVGIERLEAGVPADAAIVVEAGVGDLGRCRELCAAAERSGAGCLLVAGRPPRSTRLVTVGAVDGGLAGFDRAEPGSRIRIDFEKATMEVTR